MTRCSLALAVITLAAFTAQAANPVPRPNILLILADDFGFSDLGCYGGEIATPNLDKLAANGLRFTQFYNTARCWPTRSVLMTGHYAQQIGMDPQYGRFPAWVRTLPQRLELLGYRSYHSGKWHVTNAPRVVADGGFHHSYFIAKQDNHFHPLRHDLDDRPLPRPSRGRELLHMLGLAIDWGLEFRVALIILAFVVAAAVVLGPVH